MMKRTAALLLCLMMLLTALPAGAEEFSFSVRHGDRSRRQVAVTVDDCFNLDYTRMAYDLSVKHNVPITFFVLGIKLYPQDAELWRTIAASHNEIGNHSYGHRDLSKQPRMGVYNQVMRAQSSLDAVLGYHYPMQVFRPPYGHTNRAGSVDVNRMIQSLGYDHVILWDVSQTSFEKCKKQVQNGSILLFHTNPKDLKCLEKLIPWLIEEGYELVTVSQMLGKPPVATSTDLYEFVEYRDWQNAL